MLAGTLRAKVADQPTQLHQADSQSVPSFHLLWRSQTTLQNSFKSSYNSPASFTPELASPRTLSPPLSLDHHEFDVFTGEFEFTEKCGK